MAALQDMVADERFWKFHIAAERGQVAVARNRDLRSITSQRMAPTGGRRRRSGWARHFPYPHRVPAAIVADQHIDQAEAPVLAEAELVGGLAQAPIAEGRSARSKGSRYSQLLAMPRSPASG